MTNQIYRLAHDSHVKDSDAQRRHLDGILRCLAIENPHYDPLTWQPRHKGDFKVIRERKASDSKKQSDAKKESGSDRRETTVDKFVAVAADVMARFEAWATWAAGTLLRPTHGGHALEDHAHVAGALVDLLSTSSSFWAGVWFSEFDANPLQGMDLGEAMTLQIERCIKIQTRRRTIPTTRLTLWHTFRPTAEASGLAFELSRWRVRHDPRTVTDLTVPVIFACRTTRLAIPVRLQAKSERFVFCLLELVCLAITGPRASDRVLARAKS
jgi:hypothetical protein